MLYDKGLNKGIQIFEMNISKSVFVGTAIERVCSAVKYYADFVIDC